MIKRILLAAAAALTVILCLCGCGRDVGLFNVTANEDGSVSVTAQKAPAKSEGLSYVTIEPGQQLTIKPGLTDKSVINIKIIPYTEPEDISSEQAGLSIISKIDGAVIDEDISGATPYTFDIEPGDYIVRVTVVRKADGTISVFGA